MSKAKSKVLKLFGVDFMLLSGVWLLLTDGNSSAFGFGLIFVLCASVASYLLRGKKKQQIKQANTSVKIVKLPKFIAYFLWQSFKGGIGVAKEALSSQVSVRPGFHIYRYQLLQPNQAQEMFINVVSLLPGSLSAEQTSTTLNIHYLDIEKYSLPALHNLEYQIAQLFGIDKPLGEKI
ncbi:MAG: multicomponent Na+:H+ antiporter subunit E [Paraglaciecola sp.]|jgi:multicomponent Na+:H+ antiporter subunit E